MEGDVPPAHYLPRLFPDHREACPFGERCNHGWDCDKFHYAKDGEIWHKVGWRKTREQIENWTAMYAYRQAHPVVKSSQAQQLTAEQIEEYQYLRSAAAAARGQQVMQAPSWGAHQVQLPSRGRGSAGRGRFANNPNARAANFRGGNRDPAGQAAKQQKGLQQADKVD